MKEDSRNIYLTARRTAGVTQERWAEMLGVSVEMVRLYETGRNMPGDDVVLSMTELALLPPLAYWHMRQKSTCAAEILPPVERLPLSQAVIRLLLELQEWTAKHNMTRLLQIAQDGRVDDSEACDYGRIAKALDGIVQGALQVKYAEMEGETE